MERDGSGLINNDFFSLPGHKSLWYLNFENYSLTLESMGFQLVISSPKSDCQSKILVSNALLTQQSHQRFSNVSLNLNVSNSLVWVAIIADMQFVYFVWIQSLIPHHQLIQVHTDVLFITVYKLSSNDHLFVSTCLVCCLSTFITSNESSIVIDQQTIIPIDQCQMMPIVIYGINHDFVFFVSQNYSITAIQCWDYTMVCSEHDLNLIVSVNQ